MSFVGYYRIDLHEIPKRYERQRLLKVVRKSEVLLRKEVERIAYYFRREFSYDWLQFEKTDKTPYTAYLFANEDNHYPHVWIGACCFRTRNYGDLSLTVNALQWIWMHPYYRSKGVLKEWWSSFRREHGDFMVEPPLSPAMKLFLLKHNRASAFLPLYEGKKPNLEKMKAQLARGNN